jgi:putative copper resistance protein D
VAEAVLVGARFAHYAALTLLFGAALFRLYGAGADRARLDPFLRRLGGWSAAVALGSGLAWLMATAAGMAGEPDAAFDPAVLGGVVLDTPFGRVWAVRLVALALLLLLSGLRGAAAFVLQAAIGAGALASIALTGHAAATVGALGTLHRAADALHLLAAGAWLGALAVLARLCRPDAPSGAAGPALARFSAAGTVAVAVLAGTGLANTLIILGRVFTPGGAFAGCVAGGYLGMLALKLALFAGMLGLAALNRWRTTPRLLSARTPDALAGARRQILIEQALGAAVLAAVAVLGTLSPGCPS